MIKNVRRIIKNKNHGIINETNCKAITRLANGGNKTHKKSKKEH